MHLGEFIQINSVVLLLETLKYLILSGAYKKNACKLTCENLTIFHVNFRNDSAKEFPSYHLSRRKKTSITTREKQQQS